MSERFRINNEKISVTRTRNIVKEVEIELDLLKVKDGGYADDILYEIDTIIKHTDIITIPEVEVLIRLSGTIFIVQMAIIDNEIMISKHSYLELSSNASFKELFDSCNIYTAYSKKIEEMKYERIYEKVSKNK
jgi:hypothetical protein